jgi:tetratricopeptide (TPR) repeat protein
MKSAWKMFGDGSYVLSKTKFENIFSYSNSYSALLGVVYSNNKLGLYAESLNLLEENVKNYDGTSSQYSALLNYGDALALNGKFAKADSVYKVLLEYKPTIRYKNIADIRLKLLSKNRILDYINGSDFDKYKILKSLNSEEVFDASLQIIIELSERLNENSRSLILFLDKMNLGSISSNSAFEISKYLMRNLEFKKSLKFANISIKNCDEIFRIPVLEAHQKKVKLFESIK